MKRCAFLSMDCLDDFVCYDDLALPPLRARGWHVDTVSWRAQGVDWDTFQLVVIRSPWDYHKDWCGFLRVLDAIDRSQARLENSLSVVRWNLEKTYLRDLQIRGTRIVPTIWCERLTPFNLKTLFVNLT